MAKQVSSGRSNGGKTAYRKLRRQILTLTLKPGMDIDEKALAGQLGISRTPLREALLRLSGEHLVRITPNRGAQVAPINITDFPRYIEGLVLTQRAINYLAARRRTELDVDEIETACQEFDEATRNRNVLAMADANMNFHSRIGQAAYNMFLKQSYDFMLSFGIRLALISFSYGESGNLLEEDYVHHRQVVDEHRELLEAIRLGDSETCEQLGAQHAKLFQRRFLTQMRQNSIDHISIG